jgi:hypothetical protein
MLNAPAFAVSVAVTEPFAGDIIEAHREVAQGSLGRENSPKCGCLAACVLDAGATSVGRLTSAVWGNPADRIPQAMREWSVRTQASRCLL